MSKSRVCANTPVLSRRAALAALAASSFAVTSIVAQDAIDPILPHYRRWCQAREEWERLSYIPENKHWDFTESDRMDQIERKAFLAMVDMTPVSNEGIAALAHVLWDTAGPVSARSSPDRGVECGHPENKLIRAIYRAASGQTDIAQLT